MNIKNKPQHSFLSFNVFDTPVCGAGVFLCNFVK